MIFALVDTANCHPFLFAQSTHMSASRGLLTGVLTVNEIYPASFAILKRVTTLTVKAPTQALQVHTLRIAMVNTRPSAASASSYNEAMETLLTTLPNLKTLNFSAVTEKDRLNAEVLGANTI